MTNARPVTVRIATRDFGDWEFVRSLIIEAFAYMGPRIAPPSSALRLTSKSIQADAESDTLLLAYSAGDIVGCLFARQKNDALYISKLAVKPTLQRAGIGRKLMEAARGEARLRGIGTLELETRIELTENHATFARMGFVQTAETSHGLNERPALLCGLPSEPYACVLECHAASR